MIPTSNHNSAPKLLFIACVVYLLIPTSNHNPNVFLFRLLKVVYLLIPTSNHNPTLLRKLQKLVVYLLIPTSNHNTGNFYNANCSVVYLLIPTSNHNAKLILPLLSPLYIFWFLHQTTTTCLPSSEIWCCISFDSYIKPQLIRQLILVAGSCISFDSYIKPQQATEELLQSTVVYLLIPTSNHNHRERPLFVTQLYIFWFLHQTTTYRLEQADFQRITRTPSNKKWWVGYNF